MEASAGSLCVALSMPFTRDDIITEHVAGSSVKIVGTPVADFPRPIWHALTHVRARRTPAIVAAYFTRPRKVLAPVPIEAALANAALPTHKAAAANT